MSDAGAVSRSASFFDLYRRGEATAEQIDDFVSRWHDDLEPWSKGMPLHEYLGLTREEYEVLLYDAEALPQILAGRKLRRPLAEIMAARVRDLAAANRPEDRTTIALLGNWLAARSAV